jgi:poly(3-hydroxybutyrate) depolymerase
MGDIPEPQNGKGEWNGYGEFKVVVLVHGSVRDAERLRNSWAERAEQEGVIIVAPLWPGTLDVSRSDFGVSS